MLDSGPKEIVSELRAVLDRHGYTGPEATRLLGAPIGSEFREVDRPLYRRRLAEPLPLHTLIRLFGLLESVPEAEARAALAPLPLDALVEIGLVQREDDRVRPSVGLAVAEGLILAVDRPDPRTFAVAPDHVLGVGPPTLLLAHLTVRRRCRRVLDLGCGGGFQALLAARHADHVVGTDLNPRALGFARFNARLNGVRNVEWREGDLFTPVAGERFDLVVCNPPYVVSPETSLLFRDGGGEGGGICARVVSGLGSHLEEGGFATMLANWGLQAGEDWPERPRGWVSGSGCDAWLLHSETQDATTYAALWTRGPDAGGYDDALERWLAHYDERGIRSVAMGALVLRRRSTSGNWSRTDELPALPRRDCSDGILRVFAGEDRLRTLGSDEALLGEVLHVAEAVRLDQSVAFRGGRPEVQDAAIRLADGLPLRGAADAGTIRLLQLCDGHRTLRQVLDRLGGGEYDPDELREQTLAVARRLVALGFLVPAPQD